MDHTAADTSIGYRVELVRKAIHFSSISIPIFYYYTPRSIALGIFIPITVGAVLIDILRHYNPAVQEWFYRLFGRLLRTHETDAETKRFNGATYVLISATLCILMFPKLIAVTSFTILIVSDSMGALIGRRFGRHRFLGKSVEGSSAFFLSALVIIAIAPKIEYTLVEYLIGGTAALVGTVVEAIPWELDDNLSVPISVGMTLWAGYYLFLPAANLASFG